MILVIDGYNLLKQIFPGIKNNLEKQKSTFIKELAYYKVKKKDTISEIIVVFDAGPSNHATRTIKSDIVIIYSGVKSSADNWILNYVERNRTSEILVITLDRALREACHKLGAETLGVYDFYKILQENLFERHHQEPLSTPSLEKYASFPLDEEPSSSLSSEALDILMEQASVLMDNQKIDDLKQPSRKGKSQSLTKQERRLQTKLTKLR
jgi:predicted RNA-binding protein with PIN domain